MRNIAAADLLESGMPVGQGSRAARIHLVWIHTGSNSAPTWSLGNVWPVGDTPRDLSGLVEKLVEQPDADAWLFWDSAYGLPDERRVGEVWARAGSGHVRHAGLLMGLAGLPAMLDFVHPTSMHTSDASPDVESTSWRMSLRACLIAADVLCALGGPRSTYTSIDAAALELGYRYLKGGAIVRHSPELLSASSSPAGVEISLADELRFVHQHFGRKWAHWTFARALLSRRYPALALIAAWRSIVREPVPPAPRPYSHGTPVARERPIGRITVIIPTLQRYPYLRSLLDQLRRQTVAVDEILVVDQTPREQRDLDIPRAFADLPLHVLYQDRPGQCTSRNAAIQRSTGDWLLLLDDDVDIEPDLIQRHLQNCIRFAADASSGGAIEAGVAKQDHGHIQISSVFPAGNTLVRRTALMRTGLFDLAYDRGARADGDLGMRMHLSGALMILDPSISVFHHRAPRGGLRVHKARKITRASSRASLWQRHLPSVTEIYLMRRYFNDDQVREALWLRAFGTFSLHGSKVKRAAKGVIGAVQLPLTVWQIRRRLHEADRMAARFPQIPRLEDRREQS